MRLLMELYCFAGKLITFLVNKFLVSPHLSLAQAAHSMACSRMEYLLSVHKEEAAMQMSQEELVSLARISNRVILCDVFTLFQ